MLGESLTLRYHSLNAEYLQLKLYDGDVVTAVLLLSCLNTNSGAPMYQCTNVQMYQCTNVPMY